MEKSFNLDVNVYISNIKDFSELGNQKVQISLYEYIVNLFVTIPHFYKISIRIKA